ncbi:MAG: GTPase Era [Bacteriovoracales bacterium]|nr:GTPase Era [Bacteriovoracales bacterium]
MLLRNQHPHNRSLLISVIGPPNVGKSTLINSYMGMDFSIVTDRPQTTRQKFKCVSVVDRTELIFVDTPGFHPTGQEFNKRMNGQAKESLPGADIGLLVVDMTSCPLKQINVIKESLGRFRGKVWVVFNKMDVAREMMGGEGIRDLYEELKRLIPSLERFFVVSAKEDENLHELTGALLDEAPGRPHRFPGGDISDKSERFFVGEYIRKEAFEGLYEEIPYELAVQVDDFKWESKGEERSAHIGATILVNRPSQRAIVIGSKGSNIKRIGTNARKKIEEMIGARAHLNLHVKVVSKWFKNNKILESMGLFRVEDSKRVWRAR